MILLIIAMKCNINLYRHKCTLDKLTDISIHLCLAVLLLTLRKHVTYIFIYKGIKDKYSSIEPVRIQSVSNYCFLKLNPQ